MSKLAKQKSFDDVLSILGSERFDVAPAADGASHAAGARRVSKYGCAAEIAPGDKGGATRIIAKPGWVLGGEISRLVDRGYQKFLQTSRLEIPATAEHLRSIHKFSEELKEAAGALVLYNESLGTVSDKYVYDRLKGRETV
ncbi:MAG TPA: hypothetical protein VGM11_04100 [Acidobacteriaceae bacterium]|jgi:hypothetical protein